MKAIVVLPTVTALFASAFGAPQGQDDALPPGSDTVATVIHLMQVDIWPEYDDPRVLVMYRGELEPGVDVPRPFSFVIPRGAQIHMAGALGEQGQHLHAAFQTRPTSDTLTEVSYELVSRTFYMEFYYDPFAAQDDKEFRYALVSPYPVDWLSVNVQQPFRASEFRITPTAVDVVQDAQGFNYHRLVFTELAANEGRSVAVSYRKPDRRPSIADGDAPAGSAAMKSILIIGVVLLVGVVGYGVFRGSRRRALVSRPAGAHGPGAGRPTAPSRPQPNERKYCTACGAQMNRTDNFCPDCGTRSTLGVAG